MDKASTIQNAERKATLLVVLTVLVIAAFVGYVMVARGVFDETQRLVLVTDDSEGIRAGMNITFSGFPIGKVNRVELAADGNVRILLDIARKDAHWLRASSVFTIERGLVGEPRIRAFSAQLDDAALADNAVREALRGDASEQIPQLLSEVRTLIGNVERITAAGSPLNETIADVKQVTGRMRGPHGALAGLLGSDDNARKLIATIERSNALLEKADARLFAHGGMADTSQAALVELQGLLRDARGSLARADAILADAQAIASEARGASTDLGALRAEVEASLRKAGQLIDEINRKWPFARDRELHLP